MGRRVIMGPEGQLAIQSDDGSVRHIEHDDPELMSGDFVPTSVSEEQGVTFGERWTIKNVVSNPDKALSYLRSRGYHAIPYGGGFNFAVQKIVPGQAPDPTQWKVVDPKGITSGKELLSDILDLTTDVGTGIATGAAATAGAALGPMGSVAGAGIGGAASEFGRQALGELMGVEDNIDPMQAGLIGGVSAAVPVVGKAVGAAARPVISKAKSLVGELPGGIGDLAARVAGVGGEAGLSAQESLAIRAKTLPFQLPGVEDARQIVVNLLGKMRESSFAEFDIIEQEVQKAVAKGIKIDLTKPLRKLSALKLDGLGDNSAQERLKAIKSDIMALLDDSDFVFKRGSRGAPRVPYGGSPAPTQTGPNVVREASDPSSFGVTHNKIGGAVRSEPGAVVTHGEADVMDLLAGRGRALSPREAFGLPGVRLQLAPDKAREIMGRLDEMIRASNGFARKELINKSFVKNLRGFAGSISKTLRQKIGNRMADNMDSLSNKLRVRDFMEDKFGKGTTDALKSTVPQRGEVQSADSFIANFFGQSKGQAREAVAEFDKTFGTEIADLIKSAAKNTVSDDSKIHALFESGVSPKSIQQLLRYAKAGTHFSAEGRPTFPGLFPRFTATGQLFGPSLLAGGALLGGPLGALAGAVIASPKTIVAATRMAQSLSPKLQDMARTLSTMASSPGVSEAQKAAAITILQSMSREIGPSDRPIIRKDAKLRELMEGRR